MAKIAIESDASELLYQSNHYSLGSEMPQIDSAYVTSSLNEFYYKVFSEVYNTLEDGLVPDKVAENEELKEPTTSKSFNTAVVLVLDETPNLPDDLVSYLKDGGLFRQLTLNIDMHAKVYTLKQFKQKALDQFAVYDSKLTL